MMKSDEYYVYMLLHKDENLLLTDEEASGNGPGVQDASGQGVELGEEAAAVDVAPPCWSTWEGTRTNYRRRNKNNRYILLILTLC